MIPIAQTTPSFNGELHPPAPVAPPAPSANSVLYSQNPLALATSLSTDERYFPTQITQVTPHSSGIRYFPVQITQAMPHSGGMRHSPTQITQATPHSSGMRYLPTQITQATPHSSGKRYSPTQITQATPQSTGMRYFPTQITQATPHSSGLRYSQAQITQAIPLSRDVRYSPIQIPLATPLNTGDHFSTNQTAQPPALSGAMQCFPKPTAQITPPFGRAHYSMPQQLAPHQIAHQQSPSWQQHGLYPMEPHHQWPLPFSPRSVNLPYHPSPGLLLPESGNQTTVFVHNLAGQHHTNNYLPDRPYGATLLQGSAPAACQPWGGQLKRLTHPDPQEMLVQWLLNHQGRHVSGEILSISTDGDNCLGFFSLPDCPKVQIKFRFRLNSSHRSVLARRSVNKFHIHGQLQLNANRLQQYVYNLSPNSFLNLRDQAEKPCQIPISLQSAAIKHKKTNTVILTRELKEIVDYLNNLGSTPVRGKVLRWNKRTSCWAMHKIENKNRYIKFLFEIPEPHRNLRFDQLKRLFSAVHCKLSFDKEGLTSYVIEIGLEGFRADYSPDEIIAIRGKDVKLIPAGGETVS